MEELLQDQKGSGHKKLYRQIDFYRNKLDIKAKVERIEYDPNRTSYIALIKYDDNSKKLYYMSSKFKSW